MYAYALVGYLDYERDMNFKRIWNALSEKNITQYGIENRARNSTQIIDYNYLHRYIFDKYCQQYIYGGVILKISIAEASKLLGVSLSTMRRWEYEGRLIPDRSEGGHRRYDREALLNFKYQKENVKLTIGYCRVSSSDQREDLYRQIKTVSDYCAAKGYQFRIIQDLGSGLDYNKKGLKELIDLISKREIERIVVNYRDRLIRFGYELIEQLCVINSVELEVINYSEDKDYEKELAEDVLSVITVFSAKLYGSRSHKSKKILDVNKNLFKDEYEKEKQSI